MATSRFINGLANTITKALFTSSDIFTFKKCKDMWEFGVYPILSNFLKYSSPKILCHDREFLI
jgi:hypothetical protein